PVGPRARGVRHAHVRQRLGRLRLPHPRHLDVRRCAHAAALPAPRDCGGVSYLPWDNRDGRSHSVWLRRGALIWFAFAAFPVSQAFKSHHSTLHLAAVLTAGAAFFILWIGLVMRPGRVASLGV